MSLEAVRAFLAEKAPDVTIVELPHNTTTMTMSAAWNIAPAQVAKTLALRVGNRNLLVVACGDSRLDSRKVREELGGRAEMLPPDEVAALTGHPVGGVCPFGLSARLPVYFDLRLKAYDEVATGAGSANTALRIHPLRMAELVEAEWVDICRG